MKINNINNYHIFNNTYKPKNNTQARFISFAKKDTFKNSTKYINPVTKEYDSKIKKKDAELIKKGVNPGFSYKVAIAGIDSKTGEHSPYFNKIIKHLLPTKTDDLFDILLNRNKTKAVEGYLWSNSWQEDISCLVESIKDNEGSFNQQNYQLAKTLIDGGYKNGYVPLFYLVRIINEIKDEEGIVDKNQAAFVENLFVDRDILAETTFKIINFLKTQPKEKQENIFNTIIVQSPTPKRIDSEKDFIYRAQFCFDKEGEKIQENCELVNEIYKECPKIIFPDYQILELYKTQPHLRTLLQNMMNNEEYVFLKSYDVVKETTQEGHGISIDMLNRMATVLPYDEDLSIFNTIINVCTSPEKPTDFDEDKFKKIVDVFKINKTIPFQYSLSKEETIQMISEDNAFETLPIKKRLNVYERMKSVYDFANTLPNKKDYEFIKEKLSILEKTFTFNVFFSPTSQENIQLAKNTILKSNEANQNLTDFEKNIKNSIPLLKKYKNGLPLKYSRANFLKDIDSLMKKYPEAKKYIESKFAEDFLTKQENNANTTAIEKEINSLINKFLYENEVQTKDQKLNKELNILIKAFPEFINIIGKEQHGTHAYTLDIHTLLVLAEAISNPKYQKLNAIEKETLKNVALFHDISKKEKEIDKEHPVHSAIYAKSILNKVYQDNSQLNRICGLIRKHNFLEIYDNTDSKKTMGKIFAFNFRRPNDFEIAKIITEADLKSVNNYFYEAHKSKLNSKNLKEITDSILKLQGTGNAIFPSYIVNKEALNNHKQIIDGKEYIVINTHKFNMNEDLSLYGFEQGTQKNDLGFLVHMTSHFNKLKLLIDSEEESVLSESFITPLHKKTHADKKYGVFLKHNNYDIINMAKDNQCSGREKDIIAILSNIFDNNKERSVFVSNLLNSLQIHKVVLKQDYSKFYNDVLSNITTLKEIDPNRNYNIGEHKFTGKKLISSLKETQNQLLHKITDNRINNEILGYSPEIQGLIAKENNVKNLPKNFLNFAYENNYPIVLI